MDEVQHVRLFLHFMCGPGSLEDVRDMLEPVREFFDGLLVAYHGDFCDEISQYLEARKGVGRIVHLPYVGRHSQSRNVAIHSGPAENGDWVFVTDVLEHPSPLFCSALKATIPSWERSGANGIYYFGKPLCVEYHESLQYEGTPHEGLSRQAGGMRAFDLSGVMPDEAKVRLNVRPLRRKDPLGWVSHYARYYVEQPWGSNHCLLGNENRPKEGSPVDIYRRREQLRLEFRDQLRVTGYALTVNGMKAFLHEESLDSYRRWVNGEKIVQDCYRLWVLNDETVRDEHTWETVRVF